MGIEHKPKTRPVIAVVVMAVIIIEILDTSQACSKIIYTDNRIYAAPYAEKGRKYIVTISFQMYLKLKQ